MDKHSPKMAKTCGSPAPKRSREHNIGTSEQSSGSAEDGPARGNKRKANPDKKTHKKRRWVSELKHPNTSGEAVSVRGVKRKVRADGEEPSKKKKKKMRIFEQGNETASTSTDIGTAAESYNTSVEDVSKKGSKRKAAADGQGASRKKRRSPGLKDLSVGAQIADFEARYQELDQLGEGGCGSVFAGYRHEDNFPVAIKHIPKDKVFCKHVDKNGRQLSVEVAVMLKLAAGTNGSVGTSAPVSLLDWYDLDQELILVLERPVPSKDLLNYREVNGGSLPEEEAKIILKQLVDVAIELENKRIFHRDIKLENILIETSSDIPRVRLIDFGLSCFVKKRSAYSTFYGTEAHIPPEWYIDYTYKAGPTTVWQLGIVLFETLHAEGIFETMEFLDKGLTISNKLSKNCRDFLQTCLTEDPNQRLTLEQLRLHPWFRQIHPTPESCCLTN